MTNKKSTKKALFMSFLSLLLCCSMLIGTTFAWFTDTVSTVNNKIVAGNLDVELYWSTTMEEGSWNKVSETTNVFTDTLWEPGHTQVVYLKVVNEGTLALKYNLGINVASETPGVNVDGKTFLLSDYIQFGVKNVSGAYANRDAARNDVAGVATKLNVAYSNGAELQKGQSHTVAMVVYMPETVGNEANYLTGTNPPTIHLGINLFATQMTYENDSFGDDYDEEAAWTGVVDTSWYNTTDTEFTLTSAEDLAGLAYLVNNAKDTFKGKTIKLGADIDLNNVNWTPIGVKDGGWNTAFNGIFIGTGYTISNLFITGTTGLGLFGYVGNAAHIEGVTIDGAYVSGDDYVGAVLGTGYLAANCLKNCTVSNATIIAKPFLMANGEYDGGAKAGVIAGYAINGSVFGCKATNSTVAAYRDLGGIVGMLQGAERAVEAYNNTVENITLTYIGVIGTYAEGKTNGYMGEIAGRTSNATVRDNTAADVEMNDSVKAHMIYTVDEFIAFANAVNNGTSYLGETVMLGANIDLSNREWTPIGNSTYKFRGTFDGNGYTISNLKITGNKSYVGLFGNTGDGEIRNLTIENAMVSGRLNVGVVAGHPWTSDYTNITVKGHVEVNGMAYVGGVGGKNAYADWTNIIVDVDDTSYVKAVSTENGTAYRTYVGGVVGFMGEGGHTMSNVTSNIDVIGDVCDIGGIVGIAHYGNNYENITCTGDVTCTNAGETEVGGIAGVWNNANGYIVTMTNCTYNGVITVGETTVAATLTGSAYSATGTGMLIVDGKDIHGNWAVTDVASLENALTMGGKVTLYKSVHTTETMEVAADATVTLNLNGKTITSDYQEGSTTKHLYPINNYGTLTINDGTIKGRGIYNQDGATLTINGATVVAQDTNGGACVWSYGTGEVYLNNANLIGYTGCVSSEGYVEINGGTYTCYSGISDDGNQLTAPTYNIRAYNGLKITGGTFISRHGVISVGGGECVIEGGSYTIQFAAATTSNVIYIYGNTDMTIHSGSFISDNTSGKADSGAAVLVSGSNAKLTIHAGTFVGMNGMVSGNANTKLYGGTYSTVFGYNHYDKIQSFVADGYKAVETGGTLCVVADTVSGVVSTGSELVDVLTNAADAGSGDSTIVLLGDIDLTGTTWESIKVDGYNGAGIITIEGNGATIKGLTAPLFAGGFAGKSGIVIKNLTIADSNIVGGTLGGGAFVDTADSMQVVILENCHLINSTVTGERAGGLLGWISGYANENDGPVKTYVTITNCSVVDSTVTGAGSAGAIAGHPGASDYTYTTIENCVVKNVNVVSNDDGSWRTGAIVGTANNGHVVINNVTVENVTLTQNGVAATETKLYGRFVPGTTGTLVIDGTNILPAATTEALKNAIAAGQENIYLPAGNYTMPEPNLQGKTLIISGTKDTVIDVSAVDARDQFVTGATVVFEGVTLNFGKVNYMGFANTASLTYKNCTINGLQFLYGENVTFENCVLNSNGAEHCVWTYGAKNVSFTNCEFTYGDRGINCYSDNDVTGGKQTVNFTNCTFITENTASKGAVEINSYFFSVGIEVNMTGCTAPAYGKMAYVSEWDSTNGAKTTINIQ